MLGGRGADRRRFWSILGLLLLVCACWVLALPPSTGPDEDQHMIRAAAVARGQISGSPWDLGPFAVVKVPEGYALADGGCFVGNPRERWPSAETAPLSDDCEPLGRSKRLVVGGTSQHRGQPFYYAVLGLPTRVTSIELGAYLMRIIGAVGCSLLLASGLLSLLRLPGRRLLLLGAAVALTPEVLYLASVINSAGVEIAAAFCLWASGLALVRGPAPPDSRLVHRTGLALVVLTLTRGLSPLFAVLVVGVLAMLAGRQRLAELARRTDVRAWLAGAVVAIGVSVAWLLYVQGKFLDAEFDGSGWSDAAGNLAWWSREMVGVFGSTDVIPPAGLQVLWLGGLGYLLTWGLRHGERRLLVLAGATAVVGLGLLVTGQGYGFPPTGYWWQGRYVMPLMVGVPLLLGVAASAGRAQLDSRATHVTSATAAVLLLVHLWSFIYALRHYTVGFDGPANPFRFLFDRIWSPPLLPPVVLLVGLAAGLVGLGLVLARAARDLDQPTTIPPEAAPTTSELTAVAVS